MKTFARAWVYAYAVIALVGLVYANDGEAVAKALIVAIVQAAIAAAIFTFFTRKRNAPRSKS